MTDAWFRARVRRALRGLEAGTLTIEEAGATATFGTAAPGAPAATITVASNRLYRRVALSGALGAAESYLRGEWIADDLASALRVFARNLDAADGLEGPLTAVGNLRTWLGHRVRRNTRRGSRRNIRDHYDLGNDLFALFLDETLTYSCAVFDAPGGTLADASRAKLDLVCRRLGLGRGDRVLEIGTGWGSFALHAARHYGCRVTTTTISEAQHEVAARRIAEAGLGDRVTLLRSDYRDLTGTYDKLVSIEMIEAVGHQFLPAFFGACSRLLAPDGEMLLQAIVMPEHRYDAYMKSADFVQTYVFPGSALPSIGAISRAIGGATDFRVAEMEDLAAHYARTLRSWRERFMARLPEVRRLGYDDRFIRLWEYYLAYCEAGFCERCTGVVQMRLAKPSCRREARAVAERQPDWEMTAP